MRFPGLLALGEAAAAIVGERETQRNKFKKLEDDGWFIVDLNNNELKLRSMIDDVHPATTLHFGANSTPEDVFMAFFPPDFISDIIAKRKKEFPQFFIKKASPTRYKSVNLPVDAVYQYFACRVWIQANGKLNGEGIVDCLQRAKKHLQDENGVQFVGVDRLYLAHRVFFLRFGEEEEGRLVDLIQETVNSLGQCLCCDEKLFRYVGQHGFVRLVPNKPARLGIWHYQCIVQLANGSQYIIYTRGHNADKKQGQTIPTADIVQDWLAIAEEYGNNNVLVMDSYYFSKGGRDNSHRSFSTHKTLSQI